MQLLIAIPLALVALALALHMRALANQQVLPPPDRTILPKPTRYYIAKWTKEHGTTRRGFKIK